MIDFAIDLEWAAVAVLLAGASLLAAERVERYRAARGLDVSLGMYAAGVVAFISLALTMSLREAWLSVALSLQLPALGWIRRHVKVRALELLAGTLAGIVLVRLALNYNVLRYPLSGMPVFNWVIYGYGIPSLAFFGAAKLFGKAGAARLALALEAGALVFFVLLVSFEIRLFVSGSLVSEHYDLLEQSQQSIAWLSTGAALAVLDGRDGNRVRYYGARILMGLAAAQVILLQLWLSNPLSTGDSVGGVPLVDGLLLAYAVPAAFAFWFSNAMDGKLPSSWIAALDAAGHILAFAYVSLEVRRAFHGPVLGGTVASDAEVYAYSVVWLTYAVALLVSGIALARPVMRYAALAVLAVTSLKVFLYDMSGLTGLYRAASFLGLGLSLVGIGYLYQRLVLSRSDRKAG